MTPEGRAALRYRALSTGPVFVIETRTLVELLDDLDALAGPPPQGSERVLRAAAIYRENITGNPTQAVGRALAVGPRMAADYVSRARKGGLLPPTTRGRKLA